MKVVWQFQTSLSYLGFCHFLPHFFKKSDYWIFFVFIFNFKISPLLLKDCTNLLISKLRCQIYLTTFLLLLCFPFVLFFLSYISLLFFDCLFPAFWFPVIFWTIFMTNIFYYVALLIRHIGIISTAHIILL